MAHYGQVLDNYFDPIKDDYYKYFITYFNNPVMTKLKNVDNYSMYIIKIHALLGIEYRYVIVFVYKDDNVIGGKEELKYLKWISLQTRTLKENYNVGTHTYIPKRLPELNHEINLVKKDEEQYIYETKDLPIVITLLPKSKNVDYNSTGNVLNALETYQTIISFKN